VAGWHRPMDDTLIGRSPDEIQTRTSNFHPPGMWKVCVYIKANHGLSGGAATESHNYLDYAISNALV